MEVAVATKSREEKIKIGLENPALIQREKNNRSLHTFLKWIWPEITFLDFDDNWHLHYLCSLLEDVARRVAAGKRLKHDLLINISPGTTKTVLVSIVFPVWCWTQWYWMKFITASYSGDLSLESAELSRDLVRSELFLSVYPDIKIKPDKDTKSNFKVMKRIESYGGKTSTGMWKQGGNRFSTSVGAKLTGYHGDINIWDDPLNPLQAASDKELMRANDWIDRTLSTRKIRKKVTATIGIMQRLHENDPSGHLLAKQRKNLKHICLPGEIRNFKDLLKPASLDKYYVDDLFDVNRMDWEVLENLKVDLGQFAYAGQIGQNPVPPEGGMFHIAHFQMVNEVFEQKRYEKKVRYWDKAATIGKGAFSTGVLMSKMTDGTFLIDDVKRGQWSSDKREEIIRQTAEADGKDVTTVIEVEPGSGGKESGQGTVRGLAGHKVDTDRPTKGDGDKTQRADPFSVQVNNGNVKIRVAMWNYDFMEEYKVFPFSTYKDQVDAGSGAFNYLVKKKRARALGRSAKR